MKEINLITRKDGSQVQIVAELFCGPAMQYSIGTYVLHRQSPDVAWRVCSDRPTPVVPWSVAEYIKHGRPEMMRLSTFGERVKTGMALKARVDATVDSPQWA